MLITNIQRFSLHDGPGIRTTVFLKGCSLKCPWCSNPENRNSDPEPYIKNGKRGVYGKEYSMDEVFNEVMKDKNFYNHDGGVTFSGGEPLLQAKEMVELLKKFKAVGITTAIETCLFAPMKNLKLVIPYVDFFYVDMKFMNEVDCNEKIKGNLAIYKKNIEYLVKFKKIVVRIPVIGGFTDSADNRKSIINEIEKYERNIIKIELIKEHNLGESKYISLGLPKPTYIGVSDELLEEYKREIEKNLKIPVEVCKV